MYDLQEPFRWIADVTAIEAFESRVLDLPDFYFTCDDYRYRFDPEAKQRFLELLRKRFNSGVTYRGRALKWGSVVEQKTAELGRYLGGRTARLDFQEPSLNLPVNDKQLRRHMLSLTQQEAQRIGIGKSTLHYLHSSASHSRAFRVYRKVQKKLASSKLLR